MNSPDLRSLSVSNMSAALRQSADRIGVGRGQAIAALYGPLALVWLFVFTLEIPGIQFIIGGVIAVVGSFILFTEKRGVLEVIRAVPTHRRVAATTTGAGEL